MYISVCKVDIETVKVQLSQGKVSFIFFLPEVDKDLSKKLQLKYLWKTCSMSLAEIPWQKAS